MIDGFVWSTQVNQKYATNSITAQVFRELGRRAGVPIQEFAVKADSRCGSTIGKLFHAGSRLQPHCADWCASLCGA